jgi:hypothetical protein
LQTTEHILLESDVRDVPEPGGARKVHAVLRCHSSLRRRTFELALIDYYYLEVRAGRGRDPREYVLDLRFADHALGLTRHVPWRSLAITLALATLAGLCAWRIGSSAAPWWQHGWLPVSAALFLATACASVICAYRLTETLALYSVHGGATLLEYTGGLGTLRMAQPFMRRLAAHIRLAMAARRSSKGQHLRDEMREHFRLKEAGVLSEEEYEASKARILAHHAPGARAR